MLDVDEYKEQFNVKNIHAGPAAGSGAGPMGERRGTNVARWSVLERQKRSPTRRGLTVG